MSNKSLKSSQILRAHMTYFRRPSHISPLHLRLTFFHEALACYPAPHHLSIVELA